MDTRREQAPNAQVRREGEGYQRERAGELA